MTESYIDYRLLVENALRGVIRDLLVQIGEQGLPGDHHYYIKFATNYPGVRIPQFLQAQYPKEMTIVLQYQFYGLDVSDEEFGVTLSFNNKHERLVVPFMSVKEFYDPAVGFMLQFEVEDESGADNDDESEAVPPVGQDGVDESKKKDDGEKGVVISLDSFRKKK